MSGTSSGRSSRPIARTAIRAVSGFLLREPLRSTATSRGAGARRSAASRIAARVGGCAAARDARGNTPLMLASVYGGLASMRLLIERGAEVNPSNAAGATVAIQRGSAIRY